MHKACYRQAVFYLLILYGMAAHQKDACLRKLIHTAVDYLLKYREVKPCRECNDIHGKPRHAAHGIHIAQCIYSGNLAECIGVVYNWRKKIKCVYYSQLFCKFIHPGIVSARSEEHTSELQSQ